MWGDSKLDTIQDAHEHAQATGLPNEGVDAAEATAQQILGR